jgi:hypothetical protein
MDKTKVNAGADLSIVVVSYNTRALTLDCLRSVYAQTRDVSFDVFVVDNASADGSAAAIAAEFPQVRLFALNRNLGFAAANNLAAQHATSAWLLLLNPDTVVLDGAIDKLVVFAAEQSAKDPACGIFGGRTLFGDGQLNPTSAWGRPTPWSIFCMATGLTRLFRNRRLFNPEALPHWARDTVRAVDIVTGCFLLIRRNLWEQLGGFDPAFFMYGEEADLCLRARRRGVRCLICPDATIIHYGGASESVPAEKLVRLFSAKIRLFARHWSPTAARIGAAILRAHAFIRVAAFGVLAWDQSVVAVRRLETWQAVWLCRAQWSRRAALEWRSGAEK